MVSVFLQFLALHPFAVMLICVALMLFLFYKVKNKNSRLVNLGWLLPVFGVLNFIWGDDWNGSYVYNHGQKGTGVVVKIVPTNTWVNKVREVEYECLIKTKEGKTFEAYFVNNDYIFYPKPELWMPPGVGEEFDVKYMPGNESNFIILTNDRESAYSNKLGCTKLLQEISAARVAYDFDTKNRKNAAAYRKLLKEYIAAPCDTNVQKAYMLLLEQMKKGKGRMQK